MISKPNKNSQIPDEIESFNKLSEEESLNTTIERFNILKRLFKYTGLKLKDSLNDAENFNFDHNDLTFIKNGKYNNYEINLLVWEIESRLHIIKNMKNWISSDNNSIKSLKSILACTKEFKIEEDEFLYMSLSQVYNGLLNLVEVSDIVDICELKKCVGHYYDRVTLLMNICYDEQVLDMSNFTLKTGEDKTQTNIKFAKNMFEIFKFFKINLKTVSNSIIFCEYNNSILNWLIDNMSKCETFDDITTYYNKFYVSYKLTDLDRTLFKDDDEKCIDYNIYCKKYGKNFEAISEKNYVSKVLKNGDSPENENFNVACIFSLDHLFRQYINSYKSNICGSGDRYIIHKCPLRNNFTFKEKDKFETFITCFSMWYKQSPESDIKSRLDKI